MAFVRDVLATFLPIPGLIGTRQTTFWDLRSPTSVHETARVRFWNKFEFHFSGAAYSNVNLTRHHPVLLDYGTATASLYVNSRAPLPVLALEQLSQLVETWSQGWRSLKRYENHLCSAARVIETGFGKLMAGPTPLIEAARDLMATHQARPTILNDASDKRTDGRDLLVLSLDRSFVVAEHFDFSQLQPVC